MPAPPASAARPPRFGRMKKVRLAGDPGAVAWVARTLTAAGLLVERLEEASLEDPKVVAVWPTVWVVRPETFLKPPDPAQKPLLYRMPKLPPCLVVAPPNTELGEALVRRIPVASFEVVREGEDASLLPVRLERLLLLDRRRSQREETAYRERLRTEAKQNEILASIALAARDSLDLDEVLGAAGVLLGTHLSAHSVEIWVLEEGEKICHVFHHWRPDPALPAPERSERPLPEEGAFRRILEDRVTYIVADRAELPADSAEFAGLEQLGALSFVGIPIHREAVTLGVLGLSWEEPRAFPPEELLFFERVSDQLALAIRAAHLYGDLQEQLAALAHEQRRRELADRDRERLTAMLVHDMKSPLSALTAALELTRDKERKGGEERLARMLDGSLASARGLQGLIEDALLVYRGEDAPDTEKRPAAPAEALALPLEEARWLAQARRVTLETDVDPKLPPVKMDVAMFRRAAANLLGNAVKFSPPRGVVTAKGEMVAENGQRFFRLSVADNGPGFPAAETSRMATPYLRFSGSESVPGTGLGLTVVQKVVRAHRGRLDVAPNKPTGAVFSLWIPA
ncbi:MAG TPA: HAMP domain-containing sensor histidine kinase [Thermoanaerobaculia bacterium]|nr:HAMP domain-containing sensor histidine kinase [Thermoanaerobaculia bacterium]